MVEFPAACGGEVHFSVKLQVKFMFCAIEIRDEEMLLVVMDAPHRMLAKEFLSIELTHS